MEKWFKSFVESEETTYDPASIEKSISTLKLQMNIAKPEANVVEYCSLFFERLDSVGYNNFKDNNQKKTVKLLASEMYPKKFKDIMMQNLQYHIEYQIRR